MSIHNSGPTHSHHHIIKSAGIIGLATLCSRILGFIRDIVIARLCGVYLYAQAFVIAFRIPNLFRDLLGEGAANAALVPVFSEYRLKHTKEEFWELVNVVLNLWLVALAIITLLGIIFAPWVVRVIAPGFAVDPQKLAATILLTRIIFPYIILICLAAYATAILNTLKTFSLPAFAPCLLNISIIIFALIFGEGIKGLALGVLAGGLLQLAVQVPVLFKKGFVLQDFLKRFRHPGATMIKKLMLPRLFSSAIYQLNNFVDSAFGSLAIIVGEGGVAALYFAYRLIQFPIGIFSNAISQAILPTFSQQALAETKDEIRRSLSFGLRLNFLALLPATFGLMFLARPLVQLLFGGGKFDAYSIKMTADVLFFYAIGLSAYGAVKILQSCFFALRDTVTPAKISFLALIVNIVLNAILMFPLKISGIALATSISGINTFLILFILLRRKLGGFGAGAIISSFSRMSLASLGMGLVCRWVWQQQIFPSHGISGKILNLGLIIICGLVSYVAFCFFLRVREIHEAVNLLRRKRR